MPSPEQHEVDLGIELERRIAGIWWALMREVPTDLSRTAASVLSRLRTEGPQRVTLLAIGEHVAQPSMSMLVTRLVERGLVERLDDPADRRASRIAITELGEQVLVERARARSQWLHARLGRLAPEERLALTLALGPLEQILSGAADA